MNNFLVSIALCTYNGEKYLKEQLDSIVRQSYENIELIVCDDCSSDSTINIINEYINNYDFIKLYENDKNLGFKKNFEKAIYLCKGSYIALSDQDDIWEKNKIEILVKNIKDNVLIYSNAILIDKFSNKMNQLLIAPERNLIKGSNNKAFLFEICISGNTILFKKELLEHILPIPERVSFHDLWIAFISTTYGKITYYDKPLTLYRRYEEQITHVVKNKNNNLLVRFQQKKINKLKYVERNINNLYAFLSSEILDIDTKKLIEELIIYFENYSNVFVDFKIYKLLKKNKNEIFAVEKPNRRTKSSFKISCGLKFYKYTFFLI